jgi:SAM-dependent methyltransferase
MDEPHEACCFDEWAAWGVRRIRKTGTAARITKRLLAALERAGLEGRTVLDLGSGSGDLALAALDRGATAATGLDLGPGAVATARSLAASRGLSDRARFEVGDGSRGGLSPHDVVVLNRVLCCFPNPGPLLDNAIGAAGQVFAVTAPIDRGIRGAWNRVAIFVGNRWYALREAKYRGFRAFVHPLGLVVDTAERAGMTSLVHERHGSWDLAVYVRPALA